MALIETDTGTYDDAAVYTAGDLAGEWWWDGLGYQLKTIKGRALWDLAGNYGGNLVVLQRLASDKRGLRKMVRYVDPDTPMILVKA